MFEKLRPLLSDPLQFLNQGITSLLAIAPSVRRQMIEEYFSFDQDVMRELLGKKMTLKLRKELETINEKTKINLISVKRQFDNVHFVHKIVKEKFTILSEKKEYMPPLKDMIQQECLLSSELSEKYSRIIFIAFHQFETFKKKLRDLNYSDIDLFTQLIIKYWTISYDPFKIQLDFNVLRELKNIFGQSSNELKELRNIIVEDLKKNQMSDKKIESLMHKFPSLLKNLISIGVGLVNFSIGSFSQQVLAREIQDFFIDVWDKFVEPLTKLKLDPSEIDAFTFSIKDSFSKLKTKDSTFSSTWVTQSFLKQITGGLLFGNFKHFFHFI
jgi:hypothetical protein